MTIILILALSALPTVYAIGLRVGAYRERIRLERATVARLRAELGLIKDPAGK